MAIEATAIHKVLISRFMWTVNQPLWLSVTTGLTAFEAKEALNSLEPSSQKLKG